MENDRFPESLVGKTAAADGLLYVMQVGKSNETASDYAV
jgi:hypothetical protein